MRKRISYEDFVEMTNEDKWKTFQAITIRMNKAENSNSSLVNAFNYLIRKMNYYGISDANTLSMKSTHTEISEVMSIISAMIDNSSKDNTINNMINNTKNYITNCMNNIKEFIEKLIWE